MTSDLKIALLYILIGALWIAFSDNVVNTLFSDPRKVLSISVYKGWAFVFFTGILLYWMLHNDLKRKNKILNELKESKLKAEESDRLKTAFLKNMSHYLRTPMNSILGFVDVLKQRNIDENKRERFLSIINEQSNHLLQFIDNIIEISKLQEGQTIVNIKEFSINELLKKINKRYQIELEFLNKKDQINIHCSPLEADIIMKNDPDKIEYIFTNLLSNALKFTKNGEIMYGGVLKNENIEFYVSDTGIGIPPEKQQLIIKTFMLSDPNTSQENAGIGLGLAITNGFVSLLNGHLWLNSSNSQGTIFCFTIPVDYKHSAK
jgi:signal transduction histidine kinase